ncbi:Fic family protein [Candidatus Micrarchaeota archaeon]|nr:Fic family protein [Candidatus Micrarchaeota archaeon]
MAHFAQKRIKGKDYLYAVKSIRLPDGRVHKIAKRVQGRTGKNNRELEDYFEQKEVEARVRFAKKHYASLKLRDLSAPEKMERMRLEYRKLMSKMTDAQKTDLFDRFTVNFTYESNAIEGNSLTLKDVAIVIHENVAIPGKNLREIYETRNSRQVIDLILRGKLKVREKDMHKMHSILVKDMGIATGYKQLPNYIHGRQVLTTPPEGVAKQMGELFVWFEENRSKKHPLQLAAEFHGRFEQIHPFEDGNGRVGRFLINAMLLQAGYPPLIIRKTQRLSYFSALEDADNGRTITLENFLYARLKETHEKFFKIYVKYLE